MASRDIISAFSKICDALTVRSDADNSSARDFQIQRTVSTMLLVATGYYIGTRIGFVFTPRNQPNSTFWPANAILLAALLLAPRRMWWALLLAVFPIHMLAQLQNGVPAWTAVGWFITNISEALIGAYCIRRVGPTKALFDTVRGVIVFVLFGVLIAPLASSFLDAAVVVITGWGQGYLPIGTERFWTNVLAELTVVPVIVPFGLNGVSWFRKTSAARLSEAVLLVGTMLCITWLVFGLQPVSLVTSPALLYAPLPVLLWATTRFGSSGLSFCLLLLSVVSIWCTMHGHEPFPYASMPENVASLQVLLCLVVVPLMFLAAIMAEARRTEESLRNVSGNLIAAQEQERQRIARDLHDGLGQELALVRVQLNALTTQTSQSLNPTLAELSNQISRISTAAHEISHGLYPRELEYLGLPTAIKKLCEQAAKGRDVSVHPDIDSLPRHLQSSISLCLYRAVQEALHNVIRHSQAKDVDVALKTDGRQIVLRVVDNGVGFNPGQERGGLGLVSMRQRVRSVDGSIDITSSSKGGTRIELRVPLRENHSEDQLDIA